MGIVRHSADRPETYQEPVVNDFLETAGRIREPHMHEQAHPAREAEIDARVLDRQEAADFSWREPTNLDAPPPRPGFRQKWVRVQSRNEMDGINWNTRLRQGWTPRDPKTVPDANGFYPVATHHNQSVIQVAGSVLCEMPIQKVKARDAWVQEQNRKLEESISVETDKVSAKYVKQGLAPITRTDEVHTTVGGKRRPATMAD
jgi:hypothetical protein